MGKQLRSRSRAVAFRTGGQAFGSGWRAMKPVAASTAFLALGGMLAAMSWLPAAAHAQARSSASVSVTIRISPFASIEFPDGFDFVITVPEDKKGKGHEKDKGKGHHEHGAVIQPVLIPFKVVGNAIATIAVKPDAFLRVHRGPWLGEAVKTGSDRHKNKQGKRHDEHGKGKGKGHDDHGHGKGKGHDDHGHGNDDTGTLGYNVIVHFPKHGSHHASAPSWQGYATSVPHGFASLPGQNGAGTPPLGADASRRRQGLFGMIYVVAGHDWTIDGHDAAPGSYAGTLEVTVAANEE